MRARAQHTQKHTCGAFMTNDEKPTGYSPGFGAFRCFLSEVFAGACSSACRFWHCRMNSSSSSALLTCVALSCDWKGAFLSGRLGSEARLATRSCWEQTGTKLVCTPRPRSCWEQTGTKLVCTPAIAEGGIKAAGSRFFGSTVQRLQSSQRIGTRPEI